MSLNFDESAFTRDLTKLQGKFDNLSQQSEGLENEVTTISTKTYKGIISALNLTKEFSALQGSLKKLTQDRKIKSGPHIEQMGRVKNVFKKILQKSAPLLQKQRMLDTAEEMKEMRKNEVALRHLITKNRPKLISLLKEVNKICLGQYGAIAKKSLLAEEPVPSDKISSQEERECLSLIDKIFKNSRLSFRDWLILPKMGLMAAFTTPLTLNSVVAQSIKAPLVAELCSEGIEDLEEHKQATVYLYRKYEKEQNWEGMERVALSTRDEGLKTVLCIDLFNSLVGLGHLEAAGRVAPNTDQTMKVFKNLIHEHIKSENPNDLNRLMISIQNPQLKSRVMSYVLQELAKRPSFYRKCAVEIADHAFRERIFSYYIQDMVKPFIIKENLDFLLDLANLKRFEEIHSVLTKLTPLASAQLQEKKEFANMIRGIVDHYEKQKDYSALVNLAHADKGKEQNFLIFMIKVLIKAGKIEEAKHLISQIKDSKKREAQLAILPASSTIDLSASKSPEKSAKTPPTSTPTASSSASQTATPKSSSAPESKSAREAIGPQAPAQVVRGRKPLDQIPLAARLENMVYDLLMGADITSLVPLTNEEVAAVLYQQNAADRNIGKAGFLGTMTRERAKKVLLLRGYQNGDIEHALDAFHARFAAPLVPVATAGGLHNLTSTCYLNSVMQVMRVAPKFKEELDLLKAREPEGGLAHQTLNILNALDAGRSVQANEMDLFFNTCLRNGWRGGIPEGVLAWQAPLYQCDSAEFLLWLRTQVGAVMKPASLVQLRLHQKAGGLVERSLTRLREFEFPTFLPVMEKVKAAMIDRIELEHFAIHGLVPAFKTAIRPGRSDQEVLEEVLSNQEMIKFLRDRKAWFDPRNCSDIERQKMATEMALITIVAKALLPKLKNSLPNALPTQIVKAALAEPVILRQMTKLMIKDKHYEVADIGLANKYLSQGLKPTDDLMPVDPNDLLHWNMHSYVEEGEYQKSFTTAPGFLLQSFKRYKPTAHGRIPNVKNNFEVDLSKKMEIEITDANGIPTGNKVKYEKQGLILHSGRSMNVGHYTTLIRNANGEWIYYDDLKKPVVVDIRNPIFRDKVCGILWKPEPPPPAQNPA